MTTVATRVVEDLSVYEGNPAGWTAARGITHYRVPFTAGLTGDAIETAVAADPDLPDTCTVTYLDATDELQITFHTDDTPSEMEAPPEVEIVDLVAGVVDTLLDLLTP